MADEQVIDKKPAYTGNTVKAGTISKMSVNIPLTEQVNNNGNNEPPAETEEQIAVKAKAAEDLKNKGTGAAATEITPEKKAENLAAGLNEDGSPKATELTKEIKEANLAKGLNEDGSPKEATNKPLTDEEIKAEYEKRFPKQVDLTPEEIAKKEQEFDKRMLDFYVAQGGKIEDFALLKHVAGADLTELTEAELTKELKEIGITDPEQIKAVKKERYFQLEQAEIDAIEDPEEKALAQKKFDYGKSKLEGKGKRQKEAATEFFNTLKEAVNLSDKDVANEKEWVSNVETHFKELPRKITLELGKVDDTVIDPVEYEVPEDAITAAMNELKNVSSRKQLLFNKDGTLNYKSIADIVLKAKMFDSAAKTSYLTGATREVEKFEKIFPKNANALGVGGNNQANNGKPGKIVKAGEVQRFKQAVGQ